LRERGFFFFPGLLFGLGRVHLLETEPFMNLKISQSAAVLGMGIVLASASLAAHGQTAHSIPAPAAAGPQSPFAGVVVEEPIAFVNDQIISKSDYDRQEQELESTAKQQNWTPQQLEDQKKTLLRDLVDQQLLLSKGKELGITGETEVVKQLDAIRKQNHLDSMEALEAAAKEQGVSFEDFKEHIRDRIVTQQVIGQEVYRKVNITQADMQRFYDAHKAEFDRPESVKLNEILIPTTADDAANVAAAEAKAQDVYSQLKGGAKFEELAKTTSAGTTAAQGGELGEFKRGQLAKVLEDKTFDLQAGQYTEPIRTKQGYVILYVAQHNAGGVPPLKEVLPQVEEALGAERTEPALRAYLHQLRLEAYIEYKPGYVDTAAVVNPSKPTYSAYAPPTPKKKKRVERTRYRQKTHGSAPATQTASAASSPAAGATAAAPPAGVPSLAQAPGAATATTSGTGAAEPASGTAGAEDQVKVTDPAAAGAAAASGSATAGAGDSSSSSSSSSSAKNTQVASAAVQKPGKKEKIRFGQAPTKTLPSTTATQTVDAGATGASAATDNAKTGIDAEPQVAANSDANVPAIGEGATTTAAEKKTRFSDRSKLPKEKKAKVPKVDPFAPAAITPEEVADRQVQSQPLGLAGDTTTKKKVKPTEKTRLHDEAGKKPADATDDGSTPAATPAATPAPDTSATPPAQPK
jgi:peptidyl-prolyl cis-trans isomerase SurA